MAEVGRRTRENRIHGVNSGRQRREAAGLVEEMSGDVGRRQAVYRMDVVHTGEEPAQVIERLRNERRVRVVELRLMGKSAGEIARVLGINPNTVRLDWKAATGRPW